MEGMIHIIVDGKTCEVSPGRNLLEACLSLGYDLPYFCYHPALGSVGACRQCAVKRYKDASDTNGRIIMSCMEPVTEGMIISVNDPEAKAFRTSIIESLMLNHPHDCPICDEGGECHLQDMTLMTGHDYRRNRFKKRTYQNQYLGPFINHEMNRCIQCYRCVRYYRDYAGGRDLNVFSSHDHVYFGRQEEGVLENEFSGNLVEVCPTGVFTDKTSKRHYTRKWDLTNAPSLCVHCSVGCNTLAGERYGVLRRTMSRYNGAVNGYFLCDRGRFGYEFVNDDKRILEPQLRLSEAGGLEVVGEETIGIALSEAIKQSKKILGIGSPRAPLEANYALSALVGKENFHLGLSKREHTLLTLAVDILTNGPSHSPSLKEIEKADAVFILGEDVTNTAPLVALAVRQASKSVPNDRAVKAGIPSWHDAAMRNLVQDQMSPIFIATATKTKLDDVAEFQYRATPDQMARLGYAVAALIKNDAGSLKELEKEQETLARRIAAALLQAKKPLVITGTHMGSASLLQAAANIAWSLSEAGKEAGLSIVFPECNTLGIGLMGGKTLEQAIELVDQGEADTLVILENDLYRRADKEIIDRFLSNSKKVIVLDHLVNDTTVKADIVLPVGTYAESEGTLVNHEGRAQRYYQVIAAKGSIIESWRCIGEMIKLRDHSTAPWLAFDDVAAAMMEAFPQFSKIKGQLPEADFRMLSEKVKRQTHRFSGRTAINANRNVSEPRPPQDMDSPLTFSMEGTDQAPPSSLVPFYWKPGWNSYQAMNFYLDEPNGSMKGGDPGVRLIEADKNQGVQYFEPGMSMRAMENERLIVPVHQIFGSDELSSRAPAVAERMPGPFVLVNSKDAERIAINETGMFKLEIAQKSLEVSLMIDDNLPSGMIGLSVNLPGMEYIELPEFGKLSQ